eukprot:scaffold184619_cov35-Prasinocladus_malaysianus.AAC.1
MSGVDIIHEAEVATFNNQSSIMLIYKRQHCWDWQDYQARALISMIKPTGIVMHVDMTMYFAGHLNCLD